MRIALENGDFAAIESMLCQYEPQFLGLCYDSGHGNLRGGSLGNLERLKGRLISIHLHDNDGSSDQHRLPFTGSVDWGRLARIIAKSCYHKGISLESVMRNSPVQDEGEFLRQAFGAATRLSKMIETCGASAPGDGPQ